MNCIEKSIYYQIFITQNALMVTSDLSLEDLLQQKDWLRSVSAEGSIVFPPVRCPSMRPRWCAVSSTWGQVQLVERLELVSRAKQIQIQIFDQFFRVVLLATTD